MAVGCPPWQRREPRQGGRPVQVDHRAWSAHVHESVRGTNPRGRASRGRQNMRALLKGQTKT
eukprot:1297229-Alexandrium_andersonii.AAC.1